MTVDEITHVIAAADQTWNEQTGDWDPINPDYAEYLAEHLHTALEAEQRARYARTAQYLTEQALAGLPKTVSR